MTTRSRRAAKKKPAMRTRQARPRTAPSGSRGQAATRRSAFTPEAYSALQQLVTGYLHQDFALDYETPARAVAAFFREASSEERRMALIDWRRFQASTASFAWPDLQQAFSRLGGAWMPPSRAALLAAFKALSRSAS